MPQPPPELRVLADHPRPLGEAVRRALGCEEGRLPSRRLVARWIEAGCVRVDGEGVRDPGWPVPAGAVLDLRPCQEDGEGPRPDASGQAGRTAPLPLLHLDRHLLVVEVDVLAPDPSALEDALSACLVAAAWQGRRPVPRPVPAWFPGASGLVVAALSDAAKRGLADAFASETATLEVLALTGGGPDVPWARVVGTGPGQAVVRLQAGAGGLGALAKRLEDAGSPVTPVHLPGQRPRPALHVARIRLPHPRNRRRLEWQTTPPPWLP